MSQTSVRTRATMVMMESKAIKYTKTQLWEIDDLGDADLIVERGRVSEWLKKTQNDAVACRSGSLDRAFDGVQAICRRLRWKRFAIKRWRFSSRSGTYNRWSVRWQWMNPQAAPHFCLSSVCCYRWMNLDRAILVWCFRSGHQRNR